MKKKFFGILSLFVFILLTSTCLCLAGCGSKVTVEGTINFEYLGFTASDYNGDFQIFCETGVSSQFSSTENGCKCWYGPIKTDIKSDKVVTISLGKRYDIEKLVVLEKNNQRFTSQIKQYNDGKHLVLTIPYAEKTNYNFTISKPVAKINQVDLNFVNDDILNSGDAEIRDLLDHSQIYVENKEYSSGTNTYTGGFVPLVSTNPNGGGKQFGPAGKYITADMTKETFTLYLKYENGNKDFPFDSTFRSVFSLNGTIYPSVSVAEISGQKVYALEFETDGLNDFDTIYLEKDGLQDLRYMNARVEANSVITANMVSNYHNYTKTTFNFNRVGWQAGDQTDWATDNAITKEYGKKLYLKYQFDSVKYNGGIDNERFPNITDFANIKFLVNGKAAQVQYNDADKSFIIELGEYEMPETYSGEYGSSFTIGIDANSIKIKDEIKSVKEVTYSSQLEFGGNLLFSQLEQDNNTTAAFLYTPSADYNEAWFYVNSLCRYERFTLEITLNGQKITKTFVRGVDFFGEAADGNFQGASIFTEQESETYLLGTANDETKISYAMYSHNSNYTSSMDTSALILRVNCKEEEARTKLQVLLTEVEYRKTAIEVGGELNEGDATFNIDWKESPFEDNNKIINFELKNINNYILSASFYSNDVCVYECSFDSSATFEGTSLIEGFDVSRFSISPDSSGGNEISLKFSTTGELIFEISGSQSSTPVLITRIVITLTPAN